MSMQLEVLGMATSVLDEVVASRIEQVGHISLPFKNYFTTISTHNSNSRFNVNSASWDRVWLCYRDSGYSAVSAPKAVKGYILKVGTGTTATVGPLCDNGYFDQNSCEKYMSNYFLCKETLASGASSTTFDLNVNGASIPQFKASRNDMYEITKNSIDGYKVKTMTLDQYKTNFFIQCVRFSLPDSDFTRQASGLDTRSSAAQASINTEGLDTCNLVIFNECTSELRVGSGRAVAVIV